MKTLTTTSRSVWYLGGAQGQRSSLAEGVNAYHSCLILLMTGV